MHIDIELLMEYSYLDGSLGRNAVASLHPSEAASVQHDARDKAFCVAKPTVKSWFGLSDSPRRGVRPGGIWRSGRCIEAMSPERCFGMGFGGTVAHSIGEIALSIGKKRNRMAG